MVYLQITNELFLKRIWPKGVSAEAPGFSALEALVL